MAALLRFEWTACSGTGGRLPPVYPVDITGICNYQIKVVDSGKSGSFKVFSFSAMRRISESVAIREWSEGASKPFVGIDYLQTVVTGTCD